MSADEHGDDGEVLHQAPWVFFVTVGSCFGFFALVLFAKWISGGLY